LRFAFKPRPEFLHTFEALGDRIAGDDGAVDGADGGADHPIRLNPGFMECLIDAGLVSAECAATLKHQHYLAGKLRRPFDRAMLDVNLIHRSASQASLAFACLPLHGAAATAPVISVVQSSSTCPR
jgi:hypothetical protein